jgi:hypothetical protein
MGTPVPQDDLPANVVPEDDLPDSVRRFSSTPSGAAVGNPAMERQGIAGRRTSLGETAATIGGAGAIGAALGAASPEILTGLGAAAGSFPATAPMAPFLTGAGNVLRGNRGMAALSGGIGGATGETAGQVAEQMGAGPVLSEAARVIGGLAGPEAASGLGWAFKKVISAPALSIWHKIWKSGAQEVMDKLERAPYTLTQREREFVDKMTAEIRGSGGKTNEPLEAVGSIMGREGESILNRSDVQMRDAVLGMSGLNRPAPVARTSAEVGTELQNTILKNNEAALSARSQRFKDNEKLRDLIVAQKEGARKFINKTPEYEALVSEINAKLDNSVKMDESKSVQASYRKILDDLSNPEKDVFGQNKPLGFNAVDQVRRKLGASAGFEGKPETGYDAIPAGIAKDLYFKLREMQVNYAGGPNGPQAKLLADYRAQSEGLTPFLVATGRKATTLDKHLEGELATDPSKLPAFYFSTRKSVQDLKELTGNAALVNRAALAHADQELARLKTSAQVKDWMSKSGEWLAEVGPAHRVVAAYAGRLEAAEQAMTRATEFAAKAAKDHSMLTRQSLPAQRAVDLIKSGDTELWGNVIPAIQRSPQAKTQMVAAVRQVVGDQASSRSTIDLFSRNIRPFLEQSGIASKQEMDFIADRLTKIAEMNIPEPEKLGWVKRYLLNSTGSWAASAASRGGVGAYNYMQNQVPPEQNLPSTRRPYGSSALQGVRG